MPSPTRTTPLPVDCDRCHVRFTLLCPPGDAMLARVTCPQCHEVILVPIPARPDASRPADLWPVAFEPGTG